MNILLQDTAICFNEQILMWKNVVQDNWEKVSSSLFWVSSMAWVVVVASVFH